MNISVSVALYRTGAAQQFLLVQVVVVSVQTTQEFVRFGPDQSQENFLLLFCLGDAVRCQIVT